MVYIKINLRTIIISIVIAILMYPSTLASIAKSGENIYIAKKLSASPVQDTLKSKNDKTKVIFMFDDGWRSIYSEVYDLMNKYNYKASVQIIPSLVKENEYMHYNQLAKLYLDGWDMLNHSYSHKEDMYDNCDMLLTDFNKARKWMINRYLGENSDMLVLPYGEINPYLIGQLKDANYRNVRTSEDIIILENNEVSYYPVITLNLTTNVAVSEVTQTLKETFNNSKTVILILHKIGDTDNGYGMTYSKRKLEEIIMFIDEHSDELEVITYSEIFKKR